MLNLLSIKVNFYEFYKKILVKLIQYLFNDLREPKFIIFEKLYLIFIANKKKCKNNIDQLINDGFLNQK